MIDVIGEQLKILDTIELGNSPVVDRSNPYSVLLEQIVSSGSEVKQSMTLRDNRMHPSQARTMDDLYYHLSDIDSGVMFSLPAISAVTLLIPIDNIISYGVYNDSFDTSYKITIPAGSSVDAGGTELLVISDISVTVSMIGTNKSVWAETVGSTDINIFTEVGVLPASIATVDNTEFASIKIPVIQGSLTTYDIIVSNTTIYEEDFAFPNRFHKVIIEKNVNGIYEPVTQHYIESSYSTLSPSVYVKVGTKVKVKIPYSFIANGELTGDFRIKVYSTLGKVIVHLGSINDWSFKFGILNTLEHEAASRCAIYPLSKEVLDGGTNGIAFKDLRNKIQFRLTGFDMPITSRQLQEVVKNYGLTMFKEYDDITNRGYLALADNSGSGAHVTYSSLITLDDVDITTMPVGVESTVDYTVIDSQILTKAYDDIVKVLSVAEIDALGSTGFINKIKEINTNTYLTTIFRQVVDHTQTLSCRIYDVDNPIVNNVNIDSRNINAPLSVNVNNVIIKLDKVTNTYIVLLELIGNGDYDINKLKAILLLNSTGERHIIESETTADSEVIAANYGLTGEYLVLNIKLGLHIDEDHTCKLLSGYTSGIRNRYENAISSLYFVTSDSTIINDTTNNGSSFLSSELPEINGMIITKETIELNLYYYLKYIWTDTSRVYKNREYVLYDTDVPLTYENDVYEVDLLTGCPYILTDTTGDGNVDTISRNVLYNAGDTVYNNGDIVMKYKAGEQVLTPDGNPILTESSGVILSVGALLSEYEYTIVDSIEHKADRDGAFELLRSRLYTTLPNVNTVTLDNTVIKLKTKNTLGKVIDIYDNLYDRELNITIVIYVEENSSAIDPDTARQVIDSIIPVELTKAYIDLEAVENTIRRKLQVTAVDLKIDGIGKLTKLKDNSNRFIIPKRITTNNLIIYDYEPVTIRI